MLHLHESLRARLVVVRWLFFVGAALATTSKLCAQWFPPAISVNGETLTSNPFAPPGTAIIYSSGGSDWKVSISMDYVNNRRIVQGHNSGTSHTFSGTLEPVSGTFTVEDSSISATGVMGDGTPWPALTLLGPPAVLVNGTLLQLTGNSYTVPDGEVYLGPNESPLTVYTTIPADVYGNEETGQVVILQNGEIYLIVGAAWGYAGKFANGEFDLDPTVNPQVDQLDIRASDVVGTQLIPSTPPAWGPPALLLTPSGATPEGGQLLSFLGEQEYAGSGSQSSWAVTRLSYSNFMVGSTIEGYVANGQWVDSEGPAIMPVFKDGTALVSACGLNGVYVNGNFWALYDSVGGIDFYVGSAGYPAQLLSIQGSTVSLVDQGLGISLNGTFDSSLQAFSMPGAILRCPNGQGGVDYPRQTPKFVQQVNVTGTIFYFFAGSDDASGNSTDLFFKQGDNGDPDQFLTIYGNYESAAISLYVRGGTAVTGAFANGIMTFQSSWPQALIFNFGNFLTIFGHTDSMLLGYAFLGSVQNGLGIYTDSYRTPYNGDLSITGTYASGKFTASGWDPVLGYLSGQGIDNSSLQISCTNQFPQYLPEAAVYVNGISYSVIAMQSGGTSDTVDYRSQWGFAFTNVMATATESGTYAGGLFSFQYGVDPAPVVITGSQGRTAPYFCGGALVANGIVYGFSSGGDDGLGGHADTYLDVTGNNVLTLALPASSDTVAVAIINGGITLTGIYRDGTFDVPGVVIGAGRSTPVFSANTLAADGVLFTFAYGTDDASTSTDLYTSAAGESLIISGSMSSASVSGAGGLSLSGSFSAGHFTLTGNDWVLPARRSPFFSSSVLMVDGQEYAFSFGVQDPNGQTTDYYESGNSWQLQISGSLQAATVNLTCPQGTYAGTFANGEFDVSGLAVGVPRATPEFSSNVLSVNGADYYFTYGINAGNGIFEDFYSDGNGDSLVLSGASGAGGAIWWSTPSNSEYGTFSTGSSGGFQLPGSTVAPVNGGINYLRTAPAWWLSGDPAVLKQGAPSANFAPINQGQLKNIMMAAVHQLDINLPNGAGETLHSMMSAWSIAHESHDYVAINLGQLKNTVKPVYDRFIAEGFTYTYPWNGGTAHDFALVNIGQVKNLFAFDLTSNSNLNGVPGWRGNSNSLGGNGNLGNTGGGGPGSGGTTGSGNSQGTTSSSSTGTTTSTAGVSLPVSGGDASVSSPLVKLTAVGYSLP